MKNSHITNRVLSVILVVLMILPSPAAFAAPLLGDLDGNGALDANDVNLLKEYYIGLTELTDPQYADINQDGKINLIDLSILMNRISKSEEDTVSKSVPEIRDLNITAPAQLDLEAGKSAAISVEFSGIGIDSLDLDVSGAGITADFVSCNWNSSPCTAQILVVASDSCHGGTVTFKLVNNSQGTIKSQDIAINVTQPQPEQPEVRDLQINAPGSVSVEAGDSATFDIAFSGIGIDSLDLDVVGDGFTADFVSANWRSTPCKATIRISSTGNGSGGSVTFKLVNNTLGTIKSQDIAVEVTASQPEIRDLKITAPSSISLEAGKTSTFDVTFSGVGIDKIGVSVSGGGLTAKTINTTWKAYPSSCKTTVQVTASSSFNGGKVTFNLINTIAGTVKSQSIEVEKAERAADLQIVAMSLGKTSVRLGDSAFVQIGYTGGEAPYTVKYTLKDGNGKAVQYGDGVLNGKNAAVCKFTYENTGKYYVQVTMSDAMGQSATKTSSAITVSELQSPLSISSLQLSNTKPGLNETIHLTTTISGGNKPYKLYWDVKNPSGNLIRSGETDWQESGIIDLPFAFSRYGDFVFHVKVVDKEGQSAIKTSKMVSISRGKAEELTAASLDRRYYAFVLKGTNMALNVKNGTDVNDADVIIYNSSNHNKAQLWEPVPVSGGIRLVAGCSDTRSLDIYYGDMIPNTRVQLYDWNGSNAQIWKTYKSPDGYYVIAAAAEPSLVLTAKGAGAGSGVCLDTYTGSNLQKWSLATHAEKEKPVTKNTPVYSRENPSKQIGTFPAGRSVWPHSHVWEGKQLVTGVTSANKEVIGWIEADAIQSTVGSKIQKMVQIAETEYAKGEVIERYGNNKTKYGADMGIDGQPWCMTFVQWCAKNAGIPTTSGNPSIYRTFGCSTSYKWSVKNSRLSFIPEVGSMAYFRNTDSDYSPYPYNYPAMHVGLVVAVDGDNMTVIEGNASNSGKLIRTVYNWKNNTATSTERTSKKFLGFGLLHD